MSARILAIDTTSDPGSLAVAEDERVLETVLLKSPDGFAHVLFDEIRRLFERHNLTLLEIDCFAAASGPGSFTGVRVGLAAAKGLAEAAGKPLVGISNLRAIAAAGSASLRAVVIDARRGEVYSGVFDAELTTVVPETVGSFPEWIASLPDVEMEFLSMSGFPLQQMLSSTRFGRSPVRQVEHALAPLVAAIALREYARGKALDPAAVDANYVRRSDAELFSKL